VTVVPGAFYVWRHCPRDGQRDLTELEAVRKSRTPSEVTGIEILVAELYLIRISAEGVRPQFRTDPGRESDGFLGKRVVVEGQYIGGGSQDSRPNCCAVDVCPPWDRSPRYSSRS